MIGMAFAQVDRTAITGWLTELIIRQSWGVWGASGTDEMGDAYAVRTCQLWSSGSARAEDRGLATGPGPLIRGAGSSGECAAKFSGQSNYHRSGYM